ncbi:MAG: TonB-dependent receptor, partial [Bacteroidota bacterium]
QKESTTVLKEVTLVYKKVKDSIYTTNAIVLSDSILRQNQASLTNLLNFNSPIYFKENGLGMVSSPSFRGTTASQTAVLWNGININSQTTGQTDFNTINTRGFNKVEIMAGGSSVATGSGAIGGTINLVNELHYENGLKNEFFGNYGEFNTYGIDYRTEFSSKKFSVTAGVSRNGSDNDYPFPETEFINENGQYYNTNLSLASGYKLNKKNTLNLYANLYDGRRNFSLPTPNALRTKYTDFNTRAMLEWESILGSFISSKLKLASITEEYNFFANIDNDFFTFGEVNSFIAKYNMDYKPSNKILLTAGVHYIHNNGRGSNIEAETRNLTAASVGLKHFVSDDFFYEITFRQETNEQFGNPLLYSTGFNYQITSFYQLKFNTSKNFRIPTYNDLYWTGLGDPSLQPETSYQGELSHNFSIKNASLSVTGYYNSVTDLLQYVPDGNGIFRPQNTNEVEIYGLECILKALKKIGDHEFTASATYAYTVSENRETGRQLIYVPFHKFTSSIGYVLKRFAAYYQYINNGEVFTTTDNAVGNILDSYMVANLGADYSFGKDRSYKIGIQVLNLWNESYESVLNRPMPGRNINTYVNLIF